MICKNIIIPEPQLNNYIKNDDKLINQLKCTILVESFVGVNRIYLLDPKKSIIWFNNCINCILIFIALFIMMDMNRISFALLMVKIIMNIEYVVLILNSLLFKKDLLRDLITTLDSIGAMLNDKASKISIRRRTFLLITIFIYDFLEYVIGYVYVTHLYYDNLSKYTTFLSILAHDYECFFCCDLLALMSQKTMVIKDYIAKTYNYAGKNANELHSRKKYFQKKSSNLEVQSIHKIYEMLLKVSKQLGKVMSIPVCIY